MQSVLLNKPSFRFGDSELNFFNGIFRFLTKRDYIKDITKRIDNNFNYKLLYLLRDYSVNDKKMNTNNLMQLTNEARDNLVKLFILNFGSKK